VAEGAGRNTDKEFNHFLGIAIGSSFELYTQLIIAGELGLVAENLLEPVLSELDEIQKMIRGFKETLKIN
jgi:four helix bundle protein